MKSGKTKTKMMTNTGIRLPKEQDKVDVSARVKSLIALGMSHLDALMIASRVKHGTSEEIYERYMASREKGIPIGRVAEFLNSVWRTFDRAINQYVLLTSRCNYSSNSALDKILKRTW